MCDLWNVLEATALSITDSKMPKGSLTSGEILKEKLSNSFPAHSVKLNML